MKYSVEKPGSPSELAHHGVKGQKWGVRKEEDTGGEKSSSPEEKKSLGKRYVDATRAHEAETKARLGIAKNESDKEYMAILAKRPKGTPAQNKAAIAKNEEKFAQKFAPSGAKDPKTGEEKTGLTSAQKKLLIYGIGGAALVGGAIYLNRKAWRNIEGIPGEPIGVSAFKTHCVKAKNASWGHGGEGYFHASSFARPEFELPAGHTFFRISTAAEDEFKHATYATHSLEDFNRYLAVFTHEKSEALHHVSWTSTEPTKVPQLSTVLDTLHDIMKDDFGSFSPTSGVSVPREMAIREYESMSGGSWKSPRAFKLFAKLKEQGYGALVDEMDSGVLGETPLVIFTPENMGPKSSKPLGQSDIIKAGGQLIEITNRKVTGGSGGPSPSVKPTLEQLAELAA